MEGQLTESEQTELDHWLTYESNRILYDSLATKDLTEKIQMLNQLHPEKSWKYLEEHIPFRRKSGSLHFIRYAAAILLIGALCSVIYFIRPQAFQETLVASQETELRPGSAKALLITESGEKIHLTDNQYFFVEKDSVSRLNNEDNTLKIEPHTPSMTPDENYQTLSVPIGGEYKLILSDGSAVWLNSDTRIRFPLSFTGNKRTVFLEGEAYFEVAHHPSQPFIVSVKDMEVEVLGTKFNVKAYSDDSTVYTTLAEGRVKTIVPQSNTNLLLTPNQQCIFNKSNGKMQKREVDAYTFTGWTQGKFIFENETLDEIMKQLSRWYGIEVLYQNPQIKNYRFTGYVDRFDQISTLLDMIEKTYNITFHIQGKTIVIS